MQSVTLRQDVELKRATVRLSDLFNGVPSGIDREIAQSPAPCQSAAYDSVVLGRLAKAYRLDWQVRDGAADRLTVSSACVRITADSIRQAVVRKLKDSGTRGEIELAFDRNNIEVALPVESSNQFDLANFSYDAISKRFSGEIAPVGGSVSRGRYMISGRVTIKQLVPVLARRLETGSMVGIKDLDLIEVAEERISGAILTEAEKIVGQELCRSLPAGEMLRENDVMAPRYVQRGMLVTIKFETANLQLTAQGRALADGGKGDVVRVVNTQTNRMVEGVVEGLGVVAVQAQPLAAQKMAAVK
ncbi:MAG: flagellar basal body P-ring formation chaperone FlgA [Bdellovibrionales bacterium]